MPKNVKTFQNKQEMKQQALKTKKVSTTKVVNILYPLTNAIKLNKVRYINCLEGIF